MFRITSETAAPATGCTWTDWSDEELLAEYRCTGIREAFEEIVHRYEKELYNYLYRYLGNSANAEDVFQRTFMAILKDCDKFDTSREFRPWLYGIATNTAINYIRETKQKRHTAISIDAPIGNDADSPCMADSIQGYEQEPYEDFRDREIAGKVREAVDSLPENMRQAVYMVYFQGLSYREAAEAVGVHCCTLTSRLNGAVKKLNYMLKNVG